MHRLRRIATFLLLGGVYGFTWLVATIGKLLPRRSWKPTGRIIVTGTFHNPNWYLSHVTPLARSGVKEVILVVDAPQQPLDRVRFVCPPRWVARVLSRAGAKALWMLVCGLHYRPDLYMGYHVAPGACSALVAGKLLGRPSCYQMGGGPVEIAGGGFQAGDGVGRFLGRPSQFIERMALAVLSMFDLIVVRGRGAKAFLHARGITRSVAVITGSVPDNLSNSAGTRDIDMVFIGRLAPTKQVTQFIDVVSVVCHAMPSARAVIVGDGPLMADLRAYVSRLGLEKNIRFLGQQENVAAVLARSKVFVLTSKSEGLSIAMAEAMVAGAVPVVSNVGELSDLVADGVSGYLIEPHNVDQHAERVLSLLEDQALWSQCSAHAIETVKTYCGIEVVAKTWRQYLHDAVRQARGCRFQEDFD